MLPPRTILTKRIVKHMGKNRFTITTKLSLKGLLASKAISKTEINTHFEQHLGVVSINVKRDNVIIFEAYLRRKKNEETADTISDFNN